jgi:hypothetical protein
MTKLSFCHFRRCAFLLLAFQLSVNPVVTAAQESDADKPTGPSPATIDPTPSTQQELEKELNLAFVQIAEYRETLQQLNTQRLRLEGIRQEVLEARVSRTLDQLISLSSETAKKFLDNREEFPALEAQKVQVVEIMTSLPSLIGCIAAGGPIRA